MAFLEEIQSCFGRGEWKIDIVYPKGISICGYKKIVELGNSKIVLSLPQKNKLEICGDNLSILTLAESELYVSGKVSKIEVV